MSEIGSHKWLSETSDTSILDRLAQHLKWSLRCAGTGTNSTRCDDTIIKMTKALNSGTPSALTDLFTNRLTMLNAYEQTKHILTARQGECIRFHHTEGLTNKEVANRLGISKGVVREHIDAGMEKLIWEMALIVCDRGISMEMKNE